MGGHRQSPLRGALEEACQTFSVQKHCPWASMALTASPFVNVLPTEHITANAWSVFGNVWVLENMATAVFTEKEPLCERS